MFALFLLDHRKSYPSLSKRFVQGFSLIELSLALVLGSFLLVMVTKSFSGVKSLWQAEQQCAHLLMKMGFLTTYLSQQLRMTNPSRCHDKTVAQSRQLPTGTFAELTVMECVQMQEEWRIAPVRYFLRHHALYRKISDEPAQQLADEVEKLTVEVREIQEQRIWIRLWLLLKSQQRVGHLAPSSYYFAGQRALMPSKQYTLAWPIDIVVRKI